MRGFAVVYLILGLVLIAAGGFYLAKVTQKPIPSVSQFNQNTPAPSVLDDGGNEPVRKINYSSIADWVEFKSATGYSFEHPKAFYDASKKGEELQSNICSLYLGNDVGGVLAAKVVPYDGGSRRALFFSIYPQLEQSYTYQFEDVIVQGQKSLLIEVGPLEESGSGTGVVIPNGKNALILFWDHRGKDSAEMNNLLQSVKFNSNFNLSLCGK